MEPAEKKANGVGNKQTEKQKAKELRRKIAQKRGAMGFCGPCGKYLWATKEKADERVEKVKAKPGCKQPDLMHSYKCPQGAGYHIGHDFKLLCMSLCIGEHK